MQRGQINFLAALESSDIYRWVTLLCLYHMYSLILFNGHERCVFYRFQSKMDIIMMQHKKKKKHVRKSSNKGSILFKSTSDITQMVL